MPPLSRSRLVGLLLIGVASFALCGCVYLRLLEFKKQLGRFDEHFTLAESEDMTLRCLHPVLLADDLRWLGGAPTTTTKRDGGEDWVMRWVKEKAPGISEDVVYDMEIDVTLIDGRLAEVRVPRRYLAYVSKDLLVSMLRSTGAAKVNKGDRHADAHTEAPPAITLPNLDQLKAMLGEPTRKETTRGRIVYFYRYRLDSVEPATKPIEASFAFEPASGELRKFTARLPRGTVSYDLVPAAAKPVP